MKMNICATPVLLAVFVLANVCDNVRLQQLQDCCKIVYRRRVNAARVYLVCEGFFFGKG